MEKRGRGRPKKIPEAETLWAYFQQYKTETKGNPILVHDFVGKDADEVERRKERPLTYDGFELFCWDRGYSGGLSNYFANTDGRYSDFTSVCSRIKKEIRNDQIAGGLAGIYVPSITQRLNGLTEKVETKNENIERVFLIEGAYDPANDPIT